MIDETDSELGMSAKMRLLKERREMYRRGQERVKGNVGMSEMREKRNLQYGDGGTEKIERKKKRGKFGVDEQGRRGRL